MVEWEKLSGVNRQRQGQVGSYEGKATSQQAIVQSSHITEDIFRKFSRLEQRDLQALLDYSKEAWITGKKASYVMSDGTTDFLNLESLDHMESEYGVFVSDSGKDQDKLDVLKQLAQSMVQNGVPASTIAEMVDADNFSQIKEKIKAAEKQQQELSQAQSQAEQQLQQAQLEQQERVMENDNMNKQKDRETKIQIAEIAAEAKANTDEVTREKINKDAEIKTAQSDLKRQDTSEKVRSNQAKERLIDQDRRQKAAESRVNQKEKREERKLKEKDLQIKKQTKNKSD